MILYMNILESVCWQVLDSDAALMQLPSTLLPPRIGSARVPDIGQSTYHLL